MDKKELPAYKVKEEKAKESYEAFKSALAGGLMFPFDSPVVVMAKRLVFAAQAIETTSNIQTGFKDQLARALGSVGANFLEGFGRQNPNMGLQFYRYARGSAYEAMFWARLLHWEKAQEVQILAEELEKELLKLL